MHHAVGKHGRCYEWYWKSSPEQQWSRLNDNCRPAAFALFSLNGMKPSGLSSWRIQPSLCPRKYTPGGCLLSMQPPWRVVQNEKCQGWSWSLQMLDRWQSKACLFNTRKYRDSTRYLRRISDRDAASMSQNMTSEQREWASTSMVRALLSRQPAFLAIFPAAFHSLVCSWRVFRHFFTVGSVRCLWHSYEGWTTARIVISDRYRTFCTFGQSEGFTLLVRLWPPSPSSMTWPDPWFHVYHQAHLSTTNQDVLLNFSISCPTSLFEERLKVKMPWFSHWLWWQTLSTL